MKFLLEADENKFVSKQVVKQVYNFERVFNKFRSVFPGCPYNAIIEERMDVLFEIVNEMARKVPDLETSKRTLEIVSKFIWKVDDKLKTYVMENTPHKEVRREE